MPFCCAVPLLVWVITDAWYFLLKAVWLYQLKCWSGDFSLGEGSRDQQYPRYLCNITPDMCFSLHHLHTDLSLPLTWETSQSSYWSCWPSPGAGQAGAKLWCEAILLFYDIEGSVLGNILYDLWWLLSDMLESNTVLTLRATSIRQGTNQTLSISDSLTF